MEGALYIENTELCFAKKKKKNKLSTLVPSSKAMGLVGDAISKDTLHCQMSQRGEVQSEHR